MKIAKMRAWRVSNERQAVSTPDGPMLAVRDEFVVVVVARSWEEAVKCIAQLDRKDD